MKLFHLLLLSSLPVVTAASPEDWFQLSLEELLQVEVVSASRLSEKYLETPAPVRVVSSQDLQNSGSFHLLDALRMEPGVQVFNLSNGRWMLGIRGFETNHSNQTLVMKDGRSLNIPTLNGIYWSELDYPIDEIEQIEVVRGPGGSVWGSNAVNGVINVISRHARKTQGWHAEAGVGSELSSTWTLRYGGRLGENETFYRFYTHGNHWDSSSPVNGVSFNDEVNTLRAGMRLDHESEDRDTVLSFTAEAFRQDFSERLRILPMGSSKPVLQDVRNEGTGFSALGNLTHYRDFDETIQVTAYFENYHRTMIPFTRILSQVADIQYAHTLKAVGSHNLMWTAEMRWMNEKIRDSFTFDFPEGWHQRHLLALSLQDEWRIPATDLRWINTVKFENHTYTGGDWMLASRMAWTPNEGFTAWASAGRSMRIPSRVERDAYLRFPVMVSRDSAVLSIIDPDPDLKPEEVWAWQAGLRWATAGKWLWDASFFYNRYAGLINANQPRGPTFTNGIPTFTSQFENNRDGSSHGMELSVEWTPIEQLRLRSNVHWMKFDLEWTPATNALTSSRVFANVALEWKPNSRWFGSLALRRVESIESNNLKFPAYTALDAHLRWNLSRSWQVSLIGRNLLDRSHREYMFFYTWFEPTEVERSMLLKLKFNF
jgi:iron complex outermembrane recepter protein